MAGGDSTGGWTTPPDGHSRLRIGGWVPTFATRGDDTSTAGLATGDPPTAELPGDRSPPGGSSWFAHPSAPASVDDQPDPSYAHDSYDQSRDAYLDPDHQRDAGAGPDEWDGGAEAGEYQGRRRADWPASWSRRAVVAPVAAVAVGVLLAGVGMLGQSLTSGPSPLPGPPTPPLGLDPSPGRTTDRQGSVPTGSPGASPATASTGPPALSSSYEAEAADPGSHGQVTALAGASGGEVVRLSGNPGGTYVQFSGVTVPEPGRYRLTVFYDSGQQRNGSVTVNDGEPESFTLPSVGGAGGIGSVSLSVQLGAGDNTIWIATEGGAPVSLDRIAVGD